MKSTILIIVLMLICSCKAECQEKLISIKNDTTLDETKTSHKDKDVEIIRGNLDSSNLYVVIIYRLDAGKLKDFKDFSVLSENVYDKATYEWIDNSKLKFKVYNSISGQGESFTQTGYGNNSSLRRENIPASKIANPKILMHIQENSMDLNFMLTNEAGKMKQILEQAGFDVDVATISGEVLKADQITIKPDFMLGDVNIKEYSGFIFPCMAVDDTIVTPAEKSLVKSIVYEGKPVAAQTSAVLILATAGVLNGKKFAMEENLINLSPEFKKAVYSGSGVVQDGNIITSGTCPMMTKMTGIKDGTAELTNALIQAVKAKN